MVVLKTSTAITTTTTKITNDVVVLKASNMLQVPDCSYPTDRPPVTLIRPLSNPPSHTLYLSNFDLQADKTFRYIYVYRRSVDMDDLKASLSRTLVDYYPLAGRPKIYVDGVTEKQRMELECQGQGAAFLEASVEMTADQFLKSSWKPHRSWVKLLRSVEDPQSFSDFPLVVQVNKLSCGGMIVCTEFKHYVTDGIGSAKFLQAWSHYAADPDDAAGDLPADLSPSHSRDTLQPRMPLSLDIPFGEFVSLSTIRPQHNLVPASATFTSYHIQRLKRQCAGLKCTTFEVLAAHVWRSLVRTLNPPSDLTTTFFVVVNVRNRVDPQLPECFTGNAWMLSGNMATVGELVASPLRNAVELIQEAKEFVNDPFVRAMIDYLEDAREMPDMGSNLIVTQWSRLGLENVEMGRGNRPAFMGSLTEDPVSIFQPVAGDPEGTAVLLSVPKEIAEELEHCLIQGCFEEAESK